MEDALTGFMCSTAVRSDTQRKILLSGKRNRKPAKSSPMAATYADDFYAKHSLGNQDPIDEQLHHRARLLLQIRTKATDMHYEDVEFSVWLLDIGADSLRDVSLAAGFHDVQSMIREIQENGVDALLQRWTSLCNLTEADAQHLRPALERLEEWHRSYPTVCELAEEKTTCFQFCDSLYTIGPVWKRNINRKGWRERTFTFFRGAMVYGVLSYGENEEKGWTLLHNAHVVEAPPKECEREYCINIYVERPTKRVFLIQAGSKEAIVKWKKVIRLHRKFCRDWPEVVDTV